MVLTEGIHELTVEHVDLNGAVNDIVSVIIFLVRVGVEESSVPLSGGLRWQVGIMEHFLVNVSVLRGIGGLMNEAMNVRLCEEVSEHDELLLTND